MQKILILVLCFLQAAYGWNIFRKSPYAPYSVTCPADQNFNRAARGLGAEETAWLNGRKAVTKQNLAAFLKNANMTDFDADSFLNSASKDITIGLAFSGGGYRAMLSGAGQLAALDDRYPGALDSGLGGILQSSTYIAGTSGGSWLMGTLAGTNFSSIDSIMNNNKIWNLKYDILNYGGINIFQRLDYLLSISDDIDDKKGAGFDISLTDCWSRMLSYQIFDLPWHGAGFTFSSVQDTDTFKNFQMPLPMMAAASRTPGTITVDLTQTVYEMSPFEFGSWDPSVFEFTKTRWLGTKLVDGKPTGKCYNGFDNTGYMFGTSSSLFNYLVLDVSKTQITGALATLINDFSIGATDLHQDTAVYNPNPFYKSDIGNVAAITNDEGLYLVDGGEANQNIPFAPMTIPERQVDVLFAFDNSANTGDNWPNGESLVATYERQFLPQGNATAFPYVPDVNSFRNLNLTQRPAFFGCSAKNMTGLVQDPDAVYDIPLVVYIANRPVSYSSNKSTLKLAYSDSEKKSMVQNGFEVTSRNSHQYDSEWAACVGCAIIRREQERSGTEQSDQCKQCFQKYCWDGLLDPVARDFTFTDDGGVSNADNIPYSSTLLSNSTSPYSNSTTSSII